ncbi:dihydroneopterin aldolase [Riemerella anatipestifer]|nr:dihydroneopterin aldolase [Riemerella anatipestifer]MDY3533852.1 dihydroneopterin aldolase [Riemerella anatipestifer]MDY3535936.1 dihydroneopterin aldolase [Riemerella anatipestifer]
MVSKIILEDIKIYAYHGVLPEENVVGTYYLVNLECDVDLWSAAQTDNLEDTISYAELNDIVHQEMGVNSKLLEHVAGRIIKTILTKYPQIIYIKIKITKKSPPMRGEVQGASVVLEKDNG